MGGAPLHSISLNRFRRGSPPSFPPSPTYLDRISQLHFLGRNFLKHGTFGWQLSPCGGGDSGELLHHVPAHKVKPHDGETHLPPPLPLERSLLSPPSSGTQPSCSQCQEVKDIYLLAFGQLFLRLGDFSLFIYLGSTGDC
jgi:hypothetical protein